MSGADVGSVEEARRRWSRQLEGWAIPEHILAAAPASPYGFPTEVFARAADVALGRETPTTRTVREVLPAGGSVLDVGCGAGAACLPVADRAGRLIGVDESRELLEEFGSRVERFGVAAELVEGRWPDVAGEVVVADIAVSRNVAYNVPDLDAFVTQLTAHAVNRVVLEFTIEHPLGWLRPYWRALHDVIMPAGPVADDALAVIRATGVEPGVIRWEDRMLLGGASEAELRDFLQRRLGLTDDRRAALDAAIARHGVPRRRPVVTAWWPGAARRAG